MKRSATAAAEVFFTAPPLTFDRREALRYTGISEKLFAALELNGSLTSRAIGRNGAKMYLREQLDAVTAKLFGAAASDIDDEFENVGG